MSCVNRKPCLWNGPFLQQQERFEHFQTVYNHERPHQALGGQYPAEVYTPSTREYRPFDRPDYPFHDKTLRVTQCGRICMENRKISLSKIFAGQTVGIREVEDRIWLVSFMNYDLGFFDENVGRVEPTTNPFVTKHVNHVSGTNCKPCLWNGPTRMWCPGDDSKSC